MNINKTMICKNFESEIWLFLDGSLPDNEMNLWCDHISGCETCKNLLEETEDILSAAEHDIQDIDDNKFNMMIERATAKGGFSFNDFLTNYFIGPFRLSMIYRIALTGAAAGLIILSSAWFLLHDQNTEIEKTYAFIDGKAVKDKHIAFLQAKSALLLISKNMSKGTDCLNYLSEINKVQELVKSNKN